MLLLTRAAKHPCYTQLSLPVVRVGIEVNKYDCTIFLDLRWISVCEVRFAAAQSHFRVIGIVLFVPASCLTHTRTIPRFLVFVVSQSPKHFRSAFPTAWMLGSWMAANRLLLNDKTEALWYSSLRRQHLDPNETCTCRKCICTASRHSPESWGLPRCWCYHARSCDLNSYCPGVLRYTTPDKFYAPLSDTSSSDNCGVHLLSVN